MVELRTVALLILLEILEDTDRYAGRLRARVEAVAFGQGFLCLLNKNIALSLLRKKKTTKKHETHKTHKKTLNIQRIVQNSQQIL